MARIIATANQKGGVGKTTLTVNLAATVNDVLGGGEDSPVLLVGTDPQRSLGFWANRIGEKIPFAYTEEYDPTALQKLGSVDGYEYVFVDTPGSLENEHILKAVLEQADSVIVPITPEPMTFVPADTTITNLIEPLGIPYWVVINLWDPRDGTGDRDDTREFVRAKGWPMANTVIRRYKVHARAAAEGLVCTQYPRNRVALEAQQDFLRLAIEQGLGHGGGSR